MGVPKPTWGILPPSGLIPGIEAPKLLGRIIADVDYPTQEYEPEDPSTALNTLPRPLEVIDSDAQTFLAMAHKDSVQARLNHIFGVHVDKETGEAKTMSSKTVITRSLPQYRKVLKALMDTHGAEITTLLKNNGGKAYLVVGLKTCLDSTISDLSFVHNTTGGTIELPIGQVLAAAHAVPPVVVPDVGNPSGTLDHDSIRLALTRFVANGERIFSLQLREVRLRFLASEPSTGGLYAWDGRQATFSNIEGGNDEAFCNELSDDAEVGEDLNNALGELRVDIGVGDSDIESSILIFV